MSRLAARFPRLPGKDTIFSAAPMTSSESPSGVRDQVAADPRVKNTEIVREIRDVTN
jgi:hypothetical protein